MIMHAETMEAIRPLSNDERIGTWAARYFSAGLHRQSAADCVGGEDDPDEQITDYAKRRG